MKFSFIFILFLVLLPRPEAGVLFYDGFESGDYSSWAGGDVNGPGAGLSIESGVTRAGRYAAHFTCDSCHRSELTASGGQFYWGREYWLGFSIYLPVLPTGYRIINQHHSVPGNENWACVAGPNAFTIIVNDAGNLRLHTSTNDARVDSVPDKGSATWGTEVLYQEPAKTNTWYDIVLHFRYEPDNTGFMQVWLNGDLVIDDSGPTVYLYDLCGVERTHRQYLKIGVYLGGGDGEIYYDEIRVGDSTSSFSEVDPAGGSAAEAFPVTPDTGPGSLSVYPHPFRAGAVFQFTSGSPDRVSLYDLRGQRAAELDVRGGRAVFDGKDVSGRALAPGVYVARFTLKDREYSRKVLLR